MLTAESCAPKRLICVITQLRDQPESRGRTAHHLSSACAACGNAVLMKDAVSPCGSTCRWNAEYDGVVCLIMLPSL